MIFPGSPRWRAGLAAGLLVVLALLALRFSLGQGWFPFSSDKPRPVPEVAWNKETVAGLNLDSPCPFVPAEDALGTLPEAVRELIADTETFEGKDGRLDLKATILRVEYQPDVPLSLDGAARAAIANAAAGAGDLHPVYHITPAQISGCEARRTHYHKSVAGEDLYLTSLLVLRDRELWEVQVFSTSKAAQPAVDRLLASVSLNPPAPVKRDAENADATSAPPEVEQ